MTKEELNEKHYETIKESIKINYRLIAQEHSIVSIEYAISVIRSFSGDYEAINNPNGSGLAVRWETIENKIKELESLIQ